MILSHKKNKFESVVVRWMNLDPVIQSEVSQTEKNISYMKSRKTVLMKLFSRKELRQKCIEQTFGHNGGKRVE